MKKDHLKTKELDKLLENSGLLDIFGDDKKGIETLAGFLKEAAEGNFGNPEDIFKWQKVGKEFLKKMAA